ncbi:ran-5, partial [Pristionchus pacificus]
SERMAEKPRSKYTFGVSKNTGLSAIANKMWTQGKEEFGVQKDKPVILERKGLSDVLDKLKKDQGVPAAVESSSDSSGQPTFVFGQKLAERVVQPTHPTSSSGSSATAETLFKSAAAAEKRSTLGDNDGTNGSTATTAERLRADAEQYSKDHEKDNIASTSLIDVKTGEENDSIVHQFSCKIHSYDGGKKQWVERGLSSFKISHTGAANDDGWTSEATGENYRIVARTFGTMKLIINSPVFADMVVEKVDERRVKITAVSAEGGAPQIFLLTSNLAKTDSIGEQMFAGLKDVRARVKRAEERTKGNRKRKGEDTESVPEVKKAAEVKEGEGKEEEEEEDKGEKAATTVDDVVVEAG